MPTFKSPKELEDYIIDRIPKSVEAGRVHARKVLNHNIHSFYQDYSPTFYQRSFSIFGAVNEGKTMPTGRGAKADVGVDPSMIESADYTYSKNGKGYTLKSSWDGADILESVMLSGTHGGAAFASGKRASAPKVWEITIEDLNGSMYKLLKEELRKSGIPGN